MKIKTFQRYDGIPYTLHMTKTKINKQGDIEYVQFNEQNECCDCGLVHDVRFRFRFSNELEIMNIRNKRTTGQVRRWRKK
jgi:hypothetical protein